MPRLSWNEIQNRAVEFVATWEGETHERAESQSFWSDSPNVYGIDRLRLYRKKPFESDKERLELLFKRYQELTEAKR